MNTIPQLSNESRLKNALAMLVQALAALINLIARIIGYLFFGILCIIALVLVFKAVGIIIAAILGLFGFHRRDD